MPSGDEACCFMDCHTSAEGIPLGDSLPAGRQALSVTIFPFETASG
jgi:hypothetical protein